jgi:putative ABC transport system ATP-binding protein
MVNLIKTENLSKEFILDKKNKITVLKNINLEIKKGEFISVMGASGSGKSTLLYSISGMDKVSSGKVFFENKNLSDLNEKDLSKIRLEKMGFVFQNIHLLKNLNIMDNIVLPAYNLNKSPKKLINKKAELLSEKTGIKNLLNNEINQASGGQLQRVGICRALINNPEIIFGDEPTGALNSKSSEEIMNLFTQINKDGTTVLLVTHDVKVASKTDRIIFLKDGEVSGKLIMDKEIKDNKKRELFLTEWLTKMGF